MEEVKFYGFIVGKKEWPKFRKELVRRNLYFEPSECYGAVHIEVKCTYTEAHELDVVEL